MSISTPDNPIQDACGLPADVQAEEDMAPFVPHPHDELAAEGDVRGLLIALDNTPPGVADLPATFNRIRLALLVRSGKDAHDFAEELFKGMICSVANILFRVEHVISQQLARVSSAEINRGEPLPEHLTTKLLPLMQQLNGHLADLLHRRASTARLTDLAEKRKGKLKGAANATPYDPDDFLTKHRLKNLKEAQRKCKIANGSMK
jgi:hypothetical protein